METNVASPAIYARVSTTQQMEGTSLETQTAACQQIAEQDGQRVAPDRVLNEQASGADTDRPMLTELRRLINEGKISRIYVYSPDRLCRNPFDLMTLTEEFSAAGTQLTFVQGPSGDTSEDKLVRYILGYVGEKERAQIAERTTRGKLATARQGQMPTGTGKGLYGYVYLKDAKRREVSEFEAEIVRRIFVWALEGDSLYRIATKLNSNDIPTKGGNKWHPLTVKRILTNEAYIGVDYYGRTKTKKLRGRGRVVEQLPKEQWIRLENFSPGIVDTKTFHLVQRQLTLPKPQQNLSKTPYLLTGFITCGLCGGHVVGAQLNRRYRYYRCRATAPTSVKPASCRARYIRAEAVESIVWDKVMQVLDHPKIVLDELRKQSDGSKGDLSVELSRLRAEIRRCQDLEGRLVKLYMYGEIDDDYIRVHSGPIKLLRERYQGELQNLSNLRTQQIEAETAEADIEAYCKRIKKNLTRLDHDGKRSAFAVLNVSAVATHDQVVVKGIVPSDITTIEQTSALPHVCTLRSRWGGRLRGWKRWSSRGLLCPFLVRIRRLAGSGC
ncbi:MAG: recombinase family protein [SAR202 cluster bacterium]|nr:recombinase family protein [SAR202 cluster bacterium]